MGIVKVRSVEIPVELVEPASISGLGYSGYLEHHRDNLPPSIIVEWDGKAFCFYLEGSHANRYFDVSKMSSKVRGLLMRDPAIYLDTTSKYDPTKRWHAMGSLILKEGTISIVGSPFDDGFADPVCVPLWRTGMRYTPGEEVGFTRWSLAVRANDTQIELWRQTSVVLDE